MHDDEPLLPPLPVIRDRLTRNQRERNLLRALFRLALRAAEGQPNRKRDEPTHEADRRGVSQ